MLTRPGLTLRTHPVSVRLNHILISPGQELRKDPGGRLIAPLSASHQSDTSEAITDLPADLADLALTRIQAMLPGVAMTIADIACAHRPVPGDGLPAIGPTRVAGLSLAVMHSGVTLAAVVAEGLSDEILTGTPCPLFQPFRPARFF